MAQIVYVNEYQSSSATLEIGNDPIYRQSRGDEHIRVGAPLPTWVILIPLLGAVLWWVTKE